MKNIIFILAIMLGLQESSLASNLNQTMAQIGKLLEEIYPFILDSKNELSSREEKELREKVKNLNGLFLEAKPHLLQKGAPFKVSYEVMTEHLRATNDLFRHPQGKSFARRMLRAVPALCMNCHTQDHKEYGLFVGSTRDHFHSDFDYAEFNFATRRYDEAKKYYDLILGDAKRSYSYQQVMSALRRKLQLNVQVKNNPQEALRDLKDYLQKPQAHSLVKEDVEGWIRGLEALEKNKDFKVKKMNFSHLEKLAKKYLSAEDESSSENEVVAMRLSGLMNDLIEEGGQAKELPKLLYWLSRSDHYLKHEFLYSNSDLYLKECMKRYSSHPYAKRCYQQYRKDMIHAFTGSRGTDIPHDVQEEIFKFRQLVYGGNQKRKSSK